MALSSLLLALLAQTGAHGVAAALRPDVLPADIEVATTGGEVVQLSTLLTGKPTVVHLVTDYCDITESNMKYLEVMAEANPTVQFIAVLNFLSSSGHDFRCRSGSWRTDNGHCTADGGASLGEVAAYLPSGAKTLVVQDLYYDPSYVEPGACVDDGNNCNDYAVDTICNSGLADLCKATCGTCDRRLSDTLPTCTSACGTFWNHYGHTGETQSTWNLKDNLYTYAADKSKLTFVESPQLTYPEKAGKVMEGSARAGAIESAVSAAAAAAAPTTNPGTSAPETNPGSATTNQANPGTAAPETNPGSATTNQANPGTSAPETATTNQGSTADSNTTGSASAESAPEAPTSNRARPRLTNALRWLGLPALVLAMPAVENP